MVKSLDPDDILITPEGRIIVSNPEMFQKLREVLIEFGRLRAAGDRDTAIHGCTINLNLCGRDELAGRGLPIPDLPELPPAPGK